MKKFLALLLVCILAFSLVISLASCGGKNNNDDENSGNTDTPGTGEGEDGDQTGGSNKPIVDGDGLALDVIPVTPDDAPVEGEN